MSHPQIYLLLFFLEILKGIDLIISLRNQRKHISEEYIIISFKK